MLKSWGVDLNWGFRPFRCNTFQFVDAAKLRVLLTLHKLDFKAILKKSMTQVWPDLLNHLKCDKHFGHQTKTHYVKELKMIGRPLPTHKFHSTKTQVSNQSVQWKLQNPSTEKIQNKSFEGWTQSINITFLYISHLLFKSCAKKTKHETSAFMSSYISKQLMFQNFYPHKNSLNFSITKSILTQVELGEGLIVLQWLCQCLQAANDNSNIGKGIAASQAFKKPTMPGQPNSQPNRGIVPAKWRPNTCLRVTNAKKRWMQMLQGLNRPDSHVN